MQRTLENICLRHSKSQTLYEGRIYGVKMSAINVCKLGQKSPQIAPKTSPIGTRMSQSDPKRPQITFILEAQNKENNPPSAGMPAVPETFRMSVCQ